MINASKVRGPMYENYKMAKEVNITTLVISRERSCDQAY